MILGLVVAGELVPLLFLLWAPRLYTSSSTIAMEPQTPEVFPPETARDDSGNGDQSCYATEWEVLKSRTLAARVIRDLRLGRDPAFIGKPTKPSLISRAVSASVSLPSDYLSSWIKSLLSRKEPAPSPNVAANDGIQGVDLALIDDYLAGLTIRPEFETRMVEVAYTSTDPVLAAKLANAHVQAYIQQGFDLRTRSNETAERFLEGQLGQLEKRLEKS